DMEERDGEPRDGQQGGKKRNEHQPVQEQVAKVAGEERPGVAAEKTEARGEVVAEAAQPSERLDLRLEWIVHPRASAQIRGHAAHSVRIAPCIRGEPASD